MAHRPPTKLALGRLDSAGGDARQFRLLAASVAGLASAPGGPGLALVGWVLAVGEAMPFNFPVIPLQGNLELGAVGGFDDINASLEGFPEVGYVGHRQDAAKVRRDRINGPH